LRLGLSAWAFLFYLKVINNDMNWLQVNSGSIYRGFGLRFYFLPFSVKMGVFRGVKFTCSTLGIPK